MSICERVKKQILDVLYGWDKKKGDESCYYTITEMSEGDYGCVDKIADEDKTNDYVNSIDSDGWTSLHYAAAIGRKELVKYCLDKGVDVNAKDYNGLTAIHYAIKYGYAEVTKLLLEKHYEHITRSSKI